MDRNAAAEHFAKMLLEVGVQGTLRDLYEMMDDPIGPDKAKWQEASKWHEDLSAEGKQHVRFLVENAIITALFRVAVNFDGAQGFREADAHQIDFAVNMRIYKSKETVANERPDETIEICPTMHGDEVHDIFLNLVDDAKETKTKD